MIGAQPATAPPAIGALGAMRPAMIPNPAFAQWQQQRMAWLQQKQQRQQQFLAACELIRGDALTRFKIDIEADSTIAADEQAEKQSRTEFLTAITPFLEVVIPGLMQNPALAPLAKELGLFAVRAFKVARPLEDSFEEAFDRLAQQAATNPGAMQKPGQKGGMTKSPQEIAAEAQETQAKTQVAAQGNQVKLVEAMTEAQIQRERLAAEQDRDSAELALRGREMQGREALDIARMQHLAARDTQGLV